MEQDAQEPHGLFILYPSEGFGKDVDLEADIIAVHGLNGEAKKTWTDRQSGKLWLEDFLPSAMPKTRIMTFGYDCGLAFSKSRSGIENFAQDLLDRLRVVRQGSEAARRPIVFIAHSLGGIVVKKALVLAHEAQDFYRDILHSTKGIVFMGTPHRGSDVVPWTLLLTNLINAASLGQAFRKSLLKTLDRDSAVLSEISRQFVHRSSLLKIRSCIEQKVERPLTTLVVPECSAVLNRLTSMD
ncbi:hypothetical protein BKA56DRAFT_589804 [Ilyonectria sp. MPI-CAGE-AT-0026]|nr:hypothetical protein BKA56DRAFT_589804 [Ilyonectria sp. MPI-CAGE-AT-0026]